MSKPTISTVAVIGTGVIGRSWIQVFARAGCQTRIYDFDPAQVDRALKWIDQDLKLAISEGIITQEEAVERRNLVTSHGALAEALNGAGYVQENTPEQLDLKKSIFAELDFRADPDAILGSSTSTLDMTKIAAGLAGARRCIVAHPVNPPHVIPVVEILPGKESDPEIVDRACAFMTSVGQKPVLMNFYLFGFLLNRMQAALVREAINLVESGAADVEAVDTVIHEGLGLRWALMGPFGVAHTNADGGVREYYNRYRQAYIDLMEDLGPTPSFEDKLIEKIAREIEAIVGGKSRDELLWWRDRTIRKIREIKEKESQ